VPKFIAAIAAFVVSGGAYLADTGTAEAVNCASTITANVAVLDNPTVFNRLGAQNPNWITYSLMRDLVNRTNQMPCTAAGANCTAGNVEQRADSAPDRWWCVPWQVAASTLPSPTCLHL
jgi:hypothetical protein